MAVPVQNPVASFTANGVTTVFPYAYLLLSADDLQVTLDGVVLVAGFTVSGVGSVTGGNVTFSVAPVSGTLILRRKMSLSRLVDYVEAGDLLAATLNLDLDRIWMVLQGLEVDSSRSIKLPEETLTAQEITEDAATRASKLLGFDVAGNVATMDLFDPSALIVTAYIESLLAAGSASTARTVLAAAADASVVKLTGAQTVAGVKTFSDKPIIPDGTAAQNPVSKAQLDAAAPAGCVQFFAMSTSPTGWLKANGAAISRTTYATLFAAIGTTFGVGDGSTTFNLPDLRGEFVRGFDDAKGTDSGRVFGTAQAGQMPSHTHTQEISNSTAGGTNRGPGSNGAFLQYSGTTKSAGGTENSSENRPRNIALLACIKY